MNEQRLTQLERDVSDLRAENAALAVEVRHLNEALIRLTESVDGLKSAMDKGRGALWVVMGLSSVAGGILATVISNFFGKGS